MFITAVCLIFLNICLNPFQALRSWRLRGCLHGKTRTGVSFIPGWLRDFESRLHDDWVFSSSHVQRIKADEAILDWQKLRMRYPFQSTCKPISHRNEWSFRVYMIPLRYLVPELNSRPGARTGVNSRRGNSHRREFHIGMTSWFRVTFAWWLGFSWIDKNYACATRSSLPVNRFHTETSGRFAFTWYPPGDGKERTLGTRLTRYRCEISYRSEILAPVREPGWPHAGATRAGMTFCGGIM